MGLNDVPLLLQSTQAELDSPNQAALWDVWSRKDSGLFSQKLFLDACVTSCRWGLIGACRKQDPFLLQLVTLNPKP